MLLFLCAQFLTGCSPSTALSKSSVIDFNRSLKTDYRSVWVVRTYIVRPSINWDVYVTDTDEIDEIFNDIVTFIKTSNLYDEVREEYTGIYHTEIIYITFYRYFKQVQQYEAYYYARGTTVYPDDENNVIDDFTTWYVWDHETGNMEEEFVYQDPAER